MIYRLWVLLIIALAVLVGPFAGKESYANARFDAWQATKPFTLSSWISLPYSLSTQAEKDYFLGSGLNTFWDGVRSGSSAWQHTNSAGVPTLVMAYQSDHVDLSGFIADFNLARAAHQNLIGVVLGDEVASVFGQGGLDHMAAVREWITTNSDPTISSLLTLTSVPAGDSISGNPSGQTYWDNTYAAIRPDGFIAQVYPISSAEIKPSYYSSLEWYFNWAKQKDIAMWVYPQIYSSSELGVPSESELRLQRFTSLAYGVRGFVDFLYHADGSPPSVRGAGYWDGSGTPTQIYQHLAVINPEVSNIAKSLIHLTRVRAYHMDGRDDGDGVRHWSDSDTDLPPWLRRTWALANVTGAVNRNHLLVGMFRDDVGDEYFMVVNKDCAKDRTSLQLATPVTLSFHPSVQSIQRLSRITGEVETIPVQDNYMFSLPGGTGDLFKFNTGRPFAGSQSSVLPRLVSREPAPGMTLSLSSNNELAMTFDSDASNVTAEIRKVEAGGQLGSENLAERFTRGISADRLTVTYRENGTVLTNRTTYRVILHYADAAPFDIETLRGDINGDGVVDQADLAALMSFLEGGWVVDTRYITISQNPGSFVLSDLTPGSYEIDFLASKFLRSRKSLEVVSASVTPCSVTLKNGDVNDDNAVTLSDYDILLRNIDKVGQ